MEAHSLQPILSKNTTLPSSNLPSTGQPPTALPPATLPPSDFPPTTLPPTVVPFNDHFIDYARNALEGFEIPLAESYITEGLALFPESEELTVLKAICSSILGCDDSISLMGEIYAKRPFNYEHTTFYLLLLNNEDNQTAQRIAQDVLLFASSDFANTPSGFSLISIAFSKSIMFDAQLNPLYTSLINHSLINPSSGLPDDTTHFNRYEQTWLFYFLGVERMQSYFLSGFTDELELRTSEFYLMNALDIQPTNAIVLSSLALLFSNAASPQGGRAKLLFEKSLGILKSTTTTIWYCELLVNLSDFSECKTLLEASLLINPTPKLVLRYIQFIMHLDLHFPAETRLADSLEEEEEEEEEEVANSSLSVFTRLLALLALTVRKKPHDRNSITSFHMLLLIAKELNIIHLILPSCIDLLEEWRVLDQKKQLSFQLARLNPNDPLHLLLSELLNESDRLALTMQAYNVNMRAEILFQSQVSHWDLLLS